MSRSDRDTGLNERAGTRRARITDMNEVSKLAVFEFEALRVLHPLTRNKATLAQINLLIEQLMTHRKDNNFAVAVTGIGRGVGSSYVALNLVAALAADFRRTALLIQCNPNPSTLNRMMVPFPDKGLMDYLADEQLDVDDIVYAPGVARVRVIPYGDTRVHTRLLGAERMTDLLRVARSRYSDRFVVLDLPDAQALGHACSLLARVDATVLVVPYGVADADAVRPAVETIGSERLAGLVMNRVPG